jgi:hypothetical protein
VDRLLGGRVTGCSSVRRLLSGFAGRLDGFFGGNGLSWPGSAVSSVSVSEKRGKPNPGIGPLGGKIPDSGRLGGSEPLPGQGHDDCRLGGKIPDNWRLGGSEPLPCQGHDCWRLDGSEPLPDQISDGGRDSTGATAVPRGASRLRRAPGGGPPIISPAPPKYAA